MKTFGWWIAGISLAVPLFVIACSKNKPTAAAPVEQNAASASAAPGPPPLSLVHASAVVQDCPDAKWMHTRAAQRAIQKVIDPCIAVPGGKAHFSAALVPGGRVELASPSGDPDRGVVPTCVLKDQNLRHQVFLKHRCAFDIVLEERPEAHPAASPAASL